jgi:2-oxoglutarate dehydrogenase E1 component
LAAQDNLQLANATTPAQYFHLLRRQVVRPWRKPLVIMTPKSLLRHPRCVSSLEEMTSGTFARLLPDTAEQPGRKVERVILCNGKVFYDLEEEREKRQAWDVAILRLEQLYPLSESLLEKALSAYRDEQGRPAPVLWVQEEPENMGAWRTLRARFLEHLPGAHPFGGAWRPASSSPATGSNNSHRLEQKKLLDAAFGTAPRGLFGGWMDGKQPRSAQRAASQTENTLGNHG